MGDDKPGRKRNRKAAKASSETADHSPSPMVPSPSPAADDFVDQKSIRQKRDRRKKPLRQEPAPSSPRRTRSSELKSANGAADVPLSEAVAPPARWDEVVRVVPSMDAVVKVFCVHTEPNFSLPWQRKRQYSSSSSGFVISGRRVLTNAHSVEHHTQVKLKKRGSDTKYLATVLAIGTECDIGKR